MTGFLLLLTAIIFVSCSGSGNNPVGDNGDNNPDTELPANAAISVSGFSFLPGSLTVEAGITVVWTNKDSAPHTVTSDDASFLSSGNLA
jgi:plastocyanin